MHDGASASGTHSGATLPSCVMARFILALVGGEGITDSVAVTSPTDPEQMKFDYYSCTNSFNNGITT